MTENSNLGGVVDYFVSAVNWRDGSAVRGHGEDLPETLDRILDEMNRRLM